MNSRSKSHHGIDLDEIERHIREASANPPNQAGPAEDPLAELARIVGGGPVPRREPRVEPARIPQPSIPPQQPLAAAPPRLPSRADFQPAVAPPLSASPRPTPPSSPSIEDDIERLLQKPPVKLAPAKPAPSAPPQREEDLETAMRSLDTLLKARTAPKPPPPSTPQFDDWSLRTEATVAQPAQPEAPTFGFEHEMARASTPEARPVEPEQPVVWRDDPPQADLDFEPEPAPPPAARSKRPFIMVAAVLGVAAAGVGGALSMRGPSDRPGNGQPPVIVADRGPVKVQPANPGGLEVPDQNKLVLDRAPSGPRPTPKVVNNEEQPMDLREAVRREAALAGVTPKALPAPPALAPTPAAAPTTAPVVAAPSPQPTPPAPAIVPTPNRPEAARPEPSRSEAVQPSPVSTAASQPASSQASASQAANSSDAVNGAPEPRRVRTVAIKPPEPGSAIVETTSPMPARAPSPPPAPPPQAAAVMPAPPPVAAPPPVVAQTPVEAPPAATPPTPPKPKVQGSIEASREAARTARQTQTRNPPRSVESDDATGATGAAPLQITPPPRPASNRAPQRVAAVEPSPSPPPQPAAPTAPFLPSETAPAPAGGSFVVQLTSEGSDSSARAAISRLQSRFGELGPYSSSVQRREVRGQMRYRVRFGSMSRETAGALCASLKSKGQDCILQPN